MNEQQPSHTSTLIIMMILMLGLLASMFLTSCSANKYGCGHGHPKQSWSKMVKRINSGY
jgi:hypothetical protein